MNLFCSPLRPDIFGIKRTNKSPSIIYNKKKEIKKKRKKKEKEIGKD